MQEILTTAYNNWLLIFIVAALIVVSFCQGYIIAAKQHISDLENHLNWIRSWGENWRELALDCAIDTEGFSEDLKADLERVAARVAEEKKVEN